MTEVILFKLFAYIAFGCLTEVTFTALCDLLAPHFLSSWNVHSQEPISEKEPAWRKLRDPRAAGYTFLWMFPIYACLILLEPIHDAIREWSLFIRLPFYCLAIWAFEFFAGALIKCLIGRCPWDYSYSRWHYKGLIRFDFAPFWMLFGLVFEKFHDMVAILSQSL